MIGDPINSRVWNVKLAWKLLLPFSVVIVILGSVGSFFIVRFIGARAQDAFDQGMFRRAVEAESSVFDRSLYLLDSVRLGANFENVPESVAGGDQSALSGLLAGVPASRTDLDLVAATDARGTGLVEITRSGDAYQRRGGSSWGQSPFVRRTLGGQGDEGRNIGLVEVSGAGTMLAMAGPIKLEDATVGALIAGVRVQRAAEDVEQRVQAPVSLFGPRGELLARAGDAVELPVPPDPSTGRPARITHSSRDKDWATVYSPLRVRGSTLGTIAVSVPKTRATSPVRGATILLMLMLLTAMAAVWGVGVWLSRLILRQVNPLIEANRRLGRGGLSARAPVLSGDELGELARGFNTMAERLQASHEELESRVAKRTAELERLYAMVSHEFRSPLAAIIGHAEMMLDGGKRPADVVQRRRSATSIKLAGEELLARTNEILELAKLDSGTMQLDMTEVGIADLTDDLRGTLSGLARAAQIDVSFEVPANLPSVHADERRLRQILLNLLANAVKYTPPGGVVTVSAAPRRGDVELSVSDSGVGIPKGTGDRVFEPFYQVPGTTAQKGQPSTGLGLSLTRRFVEAMGGKIRYTSTPGGGSTFTFTLRAVAARSRSMASGGRTTRRLRRRRSAPQRDRRVVSSRSA